ncbi:MAG TPA: hypothetical protein VIV58_04750 [Kofleriaceae bacterium]
MAPALHLSLAMSTPNNRFESLSTDTLATATGGVAAGAGSNSSTWALRAQLSPLVHSLRDLNANAANNANQQNQTLMMGMMAALAARR